MLRQTSRSCNAPYRRCRIEKWPNLRKASVQVCFIKSSIAPTHGFAIHSQSLLMTTPSPPSADNRSADEHVDDPLTLITAENDPRIIGASARALCPIAISCAIALGPPSLYPSPQTHH